MNLLKKERLDDEREIQLFGKPVLHYVKKRYPRSRECYISFFPRQSLRERLSDILEFKGDILAYELEYLEKRFSKYDFDDAYLFASASGETFFTMQYFEQICKKMGSKKPLLLSNKSYSNAIFKMFYPKTENIIHFSNLFDIVEPMTPLTINKHRYIFPFTKSYFTRLEEKHKNGEDCHFYKNLVHAFGVDISARRKAEISNNCRKKVEDLIKYKALGNNFVIVSPLAASNDSLSHWFWENLCLSLNEQGYSVFLNGPDCGVDMAEYRYLASRARAVIGVRSGALDLSADTCPITVAYYLPFKRRNDWAPIRSSYIMKNFSLKVLPDCMPEHIHEFDICEIGEYTALEKTLRLMQAANS